MSDVKMLTVEAEIEQLEEKQIAIKARLAEMKIFHEDIIVINRLDMDTESWLEFDERNREGRRRSSWYGIIACVSTEYSGDAIREAKKKVLKIGDVVIYNPESAYSLNVAKFPEIWVLHIDSILTIDNGYDYMENKKANIAKKHSIIAAHNKAAYKQAQAKARMIKAVKAQGAQPK